MRFATPPREISLFQAKTEVVEDDPRNWPDRIHLAGFTYQALYADGQVTVRDRLDWLARDSSGFTPQPYQQLIAAYRAAGEEQDSKRVALEFHRRRRATLAWPGRIAGRLLDLTVGYGYRSWLAALWLLFFLAIGTAVFTIWPAGPVEKGKGPAFQPFVFTLDVLLPIVDLGQEKAWQARGAGQWLCWTIILVGWGLTTAVVTGLSRVLNRTT
ncbi:hypothetical protein GCM10027589_17300 [Actinocorallia lasiicapitis]